MKHIFVLVGCAQNPEEKLFLEQDAIALDSTTRLLNDFDVIGVEAAIRLMEAGYADEVTVFSLNADLPHLHKVLAMGATRAIMASVPDNQLTPGIVVREVLKNCPSPSETLFICGKMNVNFESSQTPQRLAMALGCPCVPLARRIEMATADELLVFCEDDAGTPCYRVQTPAVITTDLRLAEPRFPTLPGIMKAKKKPVVALSCVDTTAEPWDIRTAEIRTVPHIGRGCRWLTMAEAAERILQAARAVLGDATPCAPNSNVLSPPMPDRPLLLYYHGVHERMSDKRLEQLCTLATRWGAQLTLVSCTPSSLSLLPRVDDIFVIPLTKRDAFVPTEVLAADLARQLQHFHVAAVLAAHSQAHIRLLAAVASMTQMPLIPNLLSHQGQPGRLICAAQLLELLSPVTLPFCATLCDEEPLALVSPIPAKHVVQALPTAHLDHFAPRDMDCTPENARIILSLGRGAIPYLDPCISLSSRLGATLGASRVVVDAGLMDNAHQIGLTGHAVSPDLYIALGISGAVQHLAGLRNAPRILAVNQDKNAPIFDFAHEGVLGDVAELLKYLELLL